MPSPVPASRSKERYIWRILLIDDDEDDYVLVREMLSEAREGKFILEWAATFGDGERTLQKDRTFDAVLVDYGLGSQTGTVLIRAAVATQYPAPILLLTGQGTYEIDVEAMQAGAADYLVKGDLNAAFIERSLRYAIERKKNELSLRESEMNIRASEMKLRESEQRFRALFENRHSVMWLVDPKTGQIVDANAAACAFYGWSREELLRMKVTDINTLPPDQTQLKLSLAQASPTSVNFHFRHRLANGEIRDVEVRSGPVLIGEKTLLFSIIYDITELKKTQQALLKNESALMASEADLLKSESHLREALAQAAGVARFPEENPNPVMRASYQGEILYCNPAGQKLFQGACQVGEPVYEVLLPLVHQAIAQDREILQDISYEGKSYAFTVMPFPDEQYVNLYGQDVTARRQVEEALRQSEARFHTALSSLPMTVFTLDAHLRYTWIYHPLPDLRADLPVGKSLDELHTPEQMAEIMACMRWVRKEKQKLQKELRFEVDGAPVHYILTLEPVLDGFGALEYIVGSALDVSEQRRIEARHRDYTTKMEVHHRLLEQREMERKQIARILHDGPLQGLIALMYTMQFTQDLSRNKEISHKLAQLSEDAKKLVGELRNLCYELQPPAVARFGIKKSIQSYLVDFQQIYPLHIHLELTEADCDLPENINLTLYRIFQEGLRNILLHANADAVNIHLDYEGTNLVLMIQDNGAGFVVPQNWVEFARQGRFGFVGMNERVEAIGGTLRVVSEPGQGTVVQVTVPCEEQG